MGLILQGKYNAAKISLRFIYENENVVDALFQETKESLSEKSETSATQLEETELISEKEYINSELNRLEDSKKSIMDCSAQLTIGLGLVFLQQATGQPSVLYFANEIFQKAGINSIAAVLVGLLKFLMTLCTVFTVDKYGRRPLLLTGISFMLFALAILTFAFIGYDDDYQESDSFTIQQVVITVAMLLYVGGYQIGFGPIVWLLISEIFPLQVRGQCISLMVSSNFLWNIIITFLFPVIQASIGTSWTFFTFMIICVYALYFTYRKVPETKGLALEKIEEIFVSNQSDSTDKFSYQAQAPLKGKII